MQEIFWRKTRDHYSFLIYGIVMRRKGNVAFLFNKSTHRHNFRVLYAAVDNSGVLIDIRANDIVLFTKKSVSSRHITLIFSLAQVE